MDEIDVIRSLTQEPPGPEADARQRMAIRLTERIDGATPVGRRRASRRTLTALLMAASIGITGGAIAWAVSVSSARDTVSVQCLIRGDDSIIPATTGDPVEDCAADWRRNTGSEPPALVAYDNGHGGITVMPADEAPLLGFSPLPDGATQNVSMVQVQQTLDDYVGGLNSGCFDNATAVEMTEGTLARFDMADWTVRPAPASDFSPTSTVSPAPSTAQQCVHLSLLDPETRTVILRGSVGGSGSPDAPYEHLAVKLRSIASGCMSLEAAAQQVRKSAGELGLSEDANDYQLTEVPEAAASCTTITENVGGTIFLILRGPAE